MNQVVQETVEGKEFSDPYFFLAEAVRYTLNNRLDLASQALSRAKAVANPEQEANVHLLAVAVVSEMALVAQGQHAGKKASSHNEFGVVHFWFKGHFKETFPEAELVRFERRNGANPDFMLNISNELVPVECKLNFNARALNQLLSYLDAYGAKRGVAVGLKLTCSLPSHITFVVCPEEARHA